MSKLTPAIALTHYASLGEKRSILALEQKLKSMGFTVGRRTLTKWAEQHRWAEHVEGAARKAIVAAQGVIIDQMAQDATETVDGFQRALLGLEGASEDIIKKVRASLEGVTIKDVGQLIDLAKCAAHLTTATANIRKAVGEASKAAAGDTNIERQQNLVLADPGLINALSDWRTVRNKF